MAVEDRVAFALMFLSDSKLSEYLKKLTQKLTDEGNLSGFLLTGLASLYSAQRRPTYQLRMLLYFRRKFRRDTIIKSIPRDYR